LVLNSDVVVIPVKDLPEETRRQIEHDPDDFAISRPQSRSGSKIVDPDAAALILRFREPRSITEAVILFARERELDAVSVLEGAHTLVRGLVDGGFLLRADDPAAGGADVVSHGPRFTAGSTVLDATVIRTLDVLEDTEIAVIRRAGQPASVLKIERRRPGAASQQGIVAARFQHEAAYLRHLSGHAAPRLLNAGELDGCAYLEIDLVPGVDGATAADEWRSRTGGDSRHQLLSLVQELARTYAGLHAHGVIHGDVHPRNLLIDERGTVRLIDFGVASTTDSRSSLPQPPARGGIPFFFEPELARASLARVVTPQASEAGEQYAVAAVAWFLVTGAYCQDFRLGREGMLEDIANGPARTFQSCGVAPWPDLEGALCRALSKDAGARFASMGAFADALAAVPVPQDAERSAAIVVPAPHPVDLALARAGIDGEWSRAPLAPAPCASVTYGSAGIALGLLHVALRRGDADALALAEVWARRAMRESGRDDAFFNPEIQITPEMVGRVSPYHSASGVHAVAALVATAQADPLALIQSVETFVAATEEPPAGLDLTVGRGSIVLGASILLDALRSYPGVDTAPLSARADAAVRSIWQSLDLEPAIVDASIEYAGIAHGWAGFLYATLQWCQVSGAEMPAGVERRLDELAALALPTGRGIEWPWMLGKGSQLMTMAGWCNGTCGYVFLWTLAHRQLGRPVDLELARLAAWRTWEASEPIVTLCCGVAGRAYALLNYYRHTGERVWLDRAHNLALHAVRHGTGGTELAHSLYKGDLGLAVLLADLERPDESAMPFFEPLGYSGPPVNRE
jgi:serine/threonine-protein kinase